MSSLIEQIAIQAKATFSKDVTDPDFMENFNKLVRCVSKLQASDVELNESLQPDNSNNEREAPCFYIEVLSSETFIISMFILKSGENMPLHDHPGMHGILKVIRGSVRISTYTSVADEQGDKAVPQDVRDKVETSPGSNAVFIPVNKHEPIVVSSKDQPCILKPKEGNFHEICAIGDGDMAAFLDVLAPPYDMDERDCTFYKAFETAEQEAAIKTWLVKTPPDNRFFTIRLPYCGPEIKL